MPSTGYSRSVVVASIMVVVASKLQRGASTVYWRWTKRCWNINNNVCAGL